MPADTAPLGGEVIGRFSTKDGQLLAGQWVTLAVWNDAEGCWAAAQISVSSDAPSDPHFSTCLLPGVLTGWARVPDLSGFPWLEAPAPLDQPFLGDFGYPWPLLGIWSAEQDRFIHAELQISIYQGKHDPYFETEFFGDPVPTRWMPLPCPVSGYAL